MIGRKTAPTFSGSCASFIAETFRSNVQRTTQILPLDCALAQVCDRVRGSFTMGLSPLVASRAFYPLILRSAPARVWKDEADIGPHGSPGDAQHRPATARLDLRRSRTASLSLGLLGRTRLLTMRVFETARDEAADTIACSVRPRRGSVRQTPCRRWRRSREYRWRGGHCRQGWS
jgi:hypothetical protein